MPLIAETSHFEGDESRTVMLLLKNSLLDMDEELAMVLEIAEAEALEPTSFIGVQWCLDKSDWWRVMEEEYTTLTDMGTWRLEAALV